MAKLISPLDQVDTTTKYTLGDRVVTSEGNEYIYLPGTTSVAQYDWVVYTTTGSGLSYGSVTRLVFGTAGQVGIAQAAIVGPKYGWFQIKGVGWGNAGAVVASGSPVYASGTTATVGTARIALNPIYGTVSVGTGASGGTCKVFLNYPYYTGGQAL